MGSEGRVVGWASYSHPRIFVIPTREKQMAQLFSGNYNDDLKKLDKIIKSQGEELLRYQTYSAVETDERLLVMERRLAMVAQQSEENKESRDYWMKRCLALEDNMKDTKGQKLDALILQIRDYQGSVNDLERYIEELKAGKRDSTQASGTMEARSEADEQE